MVFILVIRRPCWCTRQLEIMANALHNNRVKLKKILFSFVLYTNMAAMTYPNRSSGSVNYQHAAGLKLFTLIELFWETISLDSKPAVIRYNAM